MPVPTFVITVGSLLAGALVQASLKKTSDAITEPVFAKAKDKIEQRFKKGKYGTIHKALLAAREDILHQCTTSEQRHQVEQILTPLFSTDSRLLSSDFFEQAGRYLLPSPGTPPAQSLAKTYRRVSSLPAVLNNEVPDETALTTLLERFLATFRGRLIQHEDFSDLRDYYQFGEVQKQTDLQTEIRDLLEAIAINTAKSVISIEDISEVRKDYLNYLARSIESHPINGFAPQVGGGTIVSLPLNEIFLPLCSVEGQPTLAKYAEEELMRQEATEMQFGLENEFHYQHFRQEMEKRNRQLKEEQEKQHPLSLANLLKSPRSVLLGDPGTGKTITTRYITYALSTNNSTHIDPEIVRLTPILIRIANYAQVYEQDKSLHLIEYVERELTSRDDFGRYLRQAVKQGQCLIILDGLDEVGNPNLRMQITERIQNMVATYSQNRFLVTSRIVGYNQSPLTQDFKHSILQELTQRDKETFVHLWYQAIQDTTGTEGQSEGADNLIKALRNKPQISRMAANPLLLTIMVLMHYRGTKLPSRRVQVYQNATDTLVEYWTTHREGVDLDAEEVKNILAPIAHYIMSSKVSGVIPQRELLPRFYQGIMDERGCSQEEAKRIGKPMLKDLNEQCGLFLERGFIDGQPVYGFMHQTFGEYLAGLHIMHKMQAGELELKEYIHRSIWYESLLLMVGQLTLNSRPQATNLIQQILDYPDSCEEVLQRNLLLVADCLADDNWIKPKLRDKILGDLAGLCRSPVSALRDDAIKRYERLSATQHREAALVILKNNYPFDDTIRLNNIERVIRAVLVKVLIHLGDKLTAQKMILQLLDDDPEDNDLHRLFFEHWPKEAANHLLQLQTDDGYEFSVQVESDLLASTLGPISMTLAQEVLEEAELIILLEKLAKNSNDEDEKNKLHWLATLANSETTDEMIFAFTKDDIPNSIRNSAAKKSLESNAYRQAATTVLQNLIVEDPSLNTSIAKDLLDTDGIQCLDMDLLHDTAWLDVYDSAAEAIVVLFELKEVEFALLAAIYFLAEGRYSWNLVEKLIEKKEDVGLAAARWMALCPGYAFRWEACQALLEAGEVDETIPLLQYLAYECHDYDSQQAMERLLILNQNERVVPLLLRMSQSVDPEEQYYATLTLAKSDYETIPDKENVPERIDLKVSILEERTKAYKTAVQDFCDKSLSSLTSLDTANNEQFQAYIALIRFSLVRLAKVSDIAVREVAVTLEELLESSSVVVRLLACRCDMETGRLDRAVSISREILTESLADLSLQTQSAALSIQWATQLQVPGGQLEILKEALSNPHVLVRHEAARALGILGDETALNNLIAALNDEDEKVRKWAAYGLGLMSDPKALMPLVERLTDLSEKEQVRVEAIRALWKLGDFLATPYLVDALNDDSSKVRVAAACWLGWLGDTSAVPPLIEALKDENNTVRLNTVLALKRLLDGRAVQPLINALNDKDKNVRWRTADALGQLGDSKAVPALVAALQDRNITVRKNAIQALGKLGDSSAVQPLRKVIENARQIDIGIIRC